MTTTITLAMESGPVEIRIQRTPDHVFLTAKRGDHQLGSATDTIRPINNVLRRQIGDLGAGRTHHIGTVLLTPDQLAQINAAIEQTTIEPAKPLGLTEQRAALARDLTSVRDAITAARATAADGEDGLGGYYTSGQATTLDEQVRSAAAALADFDRAHPEIREQLVADRETARREVVERAMLRD